MEESKDVYALDLRELAEIVKGKNFKNAASISIFII